MHPILFTLPNGFEIHVYGLIATLGLGLPMFLAHRWGKEDGMPRDFVLDLVLMCYGGTIVGARAEYVRTNWSQFSGDLPAIFNLRSGGQVFYGGLLTVIALLMIYSRVKRIRPLVLLDLMVPCLAVGLAIGRLGCLFAGCCYGAPTDLPWAITFTDPNSVAPLGVALHPTQLYETGYCLLLAGGLIWMRGRKRFTGQLVVIYFTIYPILRSLNELVRDDDQRGYFLEGVLGQHLTNAQGISATMVVASLIGWVILSRKKDVAES
jgi:phosphatidylglycerol:prolipoprotein diacylglycerol transferase